MAAKTKDSHVHKLKKLKYKSGNEIFFCTLPDCTYKINPALALGKRAICWRCDNEFIMSEYVLRLTKPHCDSCHKPKNIGAKTDELISMLHPDNWTSDKSEEPLEQHEEQQEQQYEQEEDI